MKPLLLPLLLLVGPLLAACSCDDVFPDRVKGEGATETESRSGASFSRVSLALDADVYLTQGSVSSVRVEAQRNVLNVLKTDVQDDRLSIGFGRTSVRSHDPIRIYLTLPALTSVDVSGAGRVAGQGPWMAQDVSLNVSGSGSIKLPQVAARDLRTTIAGSGSVQLGGTARQQQLTISGSGQAASFDLVQTTADVTVSGSGDARLRVAQALHATISGSGMVYYRGQPAITSRVSGSGRVVDAN